MDISLQLKTFTFRMTLLLLLTEIFSTENESKRCQILLSYKLISPNQLAAYDWSDYTCWCNNK